MERISKIPSVTQLIREGKTPEDMLDMLFEGIPYDILERRALAFQCSCNREKIERVLISLGREELANMIEKQGDTEVRCEFCTELYPFSREDIKRLLEHI